MEDGEEFISKQSEEEAADNKDYQALQILQKWKDNLMEWRFPRTRTRVRRRLAGCPPRRLWPPRAPRTVVAAPLAARADAARTAAAPACRPHNAAAPANATSECDAASRDSRLSTHRRELWQTLVRERAPLAALLLLFSAATVFGNGLVIVAVARERYLHTATNYFVTSLAVADCLVGLVVMPFSAAYEVANHAWFFGIDWCDAWRSLDVLASTASILNLCVISLDRYWAITDPFSYPARMTGRRAAALITAVWVCSGAISFPAIAWWRAVRPEHVPPYKCPFTENLSYLIFSSTISFYLPLFVMVFTYYRIYRAAVVQTRSLKLGTKQHTQLVITHSQVLRKD
ncbi:dopamine receptor 2-like, partial [Schistocerca serialis cubense]|uniref:dopamine receptor 2-like n=1 Tax=Schistocerca serialis cubense TaxID=2023355 RepID=UPI00214F29A6